MIIWLGYLNLRVASATREVLCALPLSTEKLLFSGESYENNEVSLGLLLGPFPRRCPSLDPVPLGPESFPDLG